MATSTSTDAQTDPFVPILKRSDDGDPVAVRGLFSEHRRQRQEAQHDLMLESATLKPDPILRSILDSGNEESDPRHCITLVSRPKSIVKDAILAIQEKMRNLCRSLELPEDFIWFSPSEKLHITLFEYISGSDQETVARIARTFDQEFLRKLSDAPDPAPVLDEPALSYDSVAIALSFLPSIPSSSSSSSSNFRNYLKYRHDLYLSSIEFRERYNNGSRISSSDGDQGGFKLPPPSARYCLPTAHISIARFIQEIPTGKVHRLAEGLKRLSKEVEEEFKDLEETLNEQNQVCIGRNWYGGGEVLKPRE